MYKVRILASALALASDSMAIVVASVAQAADYPNRPIRVIVPFAAVGTTDIIARLVT